MSLWVSNLGSVNQPFYLLGHVSLFLWVVGTRLSQEIKIATVLVKISFLIVKSEWPIQGAGIRDVMRRPCAIQTTWPCPPLRPFRHDSNEYRAIHLATAWLRELLKSCHCWQPIVFGFSVWIYFRSRFCFWIWPPCRRFKIRGFPYPRWTAILGFRASSTRSIWLWGASFQPSIILRLWTWLAKLFETNTTEPYYINVVAHPRAIMTMCRLTL